jgi:hypothetical protein
MQLVLIFMIPNKRNFEGKGLKHFRAKRVEIEPNLDCASLPPRVAQLAKKFSVENRDFEIGRDFPALAMHFGCADS